jgi:hypothetical protein
MKTCERSELQLESQIRNRRLAMPFTTAQLAVQMNDPNLILWAGSNLGDQGPMVPLYTAYFDNLQLWITNNGGANPFGWQNVAGLTHVNGNQVALQGPAQRAPFNDAFDDVRANLNNPGFRLFQAAEAAQRLINVLIRMG